jgi:O-antigen/teichoic acid export membrane protein
MWSGLSLVVAQAIRLLALAFLARVLTAEDYGVVSMALIVTGLMMLVNELGMVAAIVQRPDLTARHVSTAFWVNVATGVALAAIGVAASPAAGWYFRNDEVAPVLAALSLGFVFGAAGLSHRALLQRRMDFRRLTYTEIGAELAFVCVAVVLAALGAQLWAFVGALLARPLAQTLLLWWLVPWRPAREFDRECLSDFLGFGANVMGFGVANYARTNVDYLVVGRRLGDAALGHYTMAFQLTSLPVARIAGVVTRVAFPAFSGVQDDLPRLRRGYLRSVNYICIVTFPLIVGLAVLADPFVAVALGPRWSPVAQLVQILSIAVIVKALSTATGSALKARGRPDLAFRWSMVMLVVTGVAVLAGARYGSEGVAVAVSLCSLVSAPVVHAMTNRVIGLQWRRLAGAVAPAVASTAAMAAGLLAVVELLSRHPNANDLTVLLVAVPLGAVVYGAALWFTGRATILEMVDSFRRRGSTAPVSPSTGQYGGREHDTKAKGNGGVH